LYLLVASALSVSGQQTKPGALPAWTVGHSNAPVVIEVFNDYQCPPCARFNEQLKQIEAKYQDNVQIIFRNFPLRPLHSNALLAAQTAEAAGLQRHFVQMINLLYDNTKEWNESKNPRRLFISYARKLGLNLRQFALDLDSALVRERIRLDVERGKSLEVMGTPTILLNGKMIEPELAADLMPLIDQALSRPRPIIHPLLSNDQAIPADTLITLERSCSRCEGYGPFYTLKIFADGVVVYRGTQFVRKKGTVKSRITQEQLRQVIAEFDKARYFSLKDKYERPAEGCSGSWTDHPSATTSIRINGRWKTIFHYYGCREKSSEGRPGAVYPKELFELERRIDELVGSKQWTQ
jgi:protein-disulfide isomerase